MFSERWVCSCLFQKNLRILSLRFHLNQRNHADPRSDAGGAVGAGRVAHHREMMGAIQMGQAQHLSGLMYVGDGQNELDGRAQVFAPCR